MMNYELLCTFADKTTRMKEKREHSWFRYLAGLRRGWRSLFVIVMAAVLLEMVSAVQYYYTHGLLEDELEHRVLMELEGEVFALKQTLNSAEQTLQEHLWDVKRSLQQPDSIYGVLRRVVSDNKKVKGAFVAFVPSRSPRKGRLFEPYAYENGDTILTEQLGDKVGHDYTRHPAFKKTLAERQPFWSDPYRYKGKVGEQLLTTYSYPLVDKDGDVIAVYGLDVSLTWLGDTLNTHRHQPSSFNMLLTRSGLLVSGPSEHLVSKKRADRVLGIVNDSTVRRDTLMGGHVDVIKFYDKEKEDDGYIYALKMTESPYWQVVKVCYDKEVYGKLDTLRLYIALLMLMGFLLIIFITHRTTLNLVKLQRADMEQERISSELQVAWKIQQSMLPKQFPPFPERNDIDIYGSLAPAREVGGDLFDFFIRDEKLFFCIGDVSGKGVPSSIVMAQAHSLFRVATMKINNPAHVMRILNELLCQNNESNMFITFFIGVLDLPTGRLRYCNAGHDCPVLVGQGSIDAKPHLPLGVFSDTNYSLQELEVQSGTMLFLYTDGLTEAKNEAHQLFGLKRLLESLTDDDSCETLIAHMTEAVHRFVENAEQSDDLTMLAIRYQRQEYTDVLCESIVLKNDVRQTRQLNDFIKQVTARLSMDSKLAHNIRLAVEEAVVNVMEYAYSEGQEGNVTVTMQSNGVQLKVTIMDTGVAFDPTEKDTADTTLSAEDRPIGGLGLLMMRELMDSINYERENGQNILTLRKKYK